jgi:hypothetical protein
LLGNEEFTLVIETTSKSQTIKTTRTSESESPKKGLFSFPSFSRSRSNSLNDAASVKSDNSGINSDFQMDVTKTVRLRAANSQVRPIIHFSMILSYDNRYFTIGKIIMGNDVRKNV